MDGIRLPVVVASKYLGISLNKKNDDNEHALAKFNKVQQCFYGLSSFGIKLPGINPRSKAFLFNTFYKPVGTYGLGVMKLKKNIGIPYSTHMRHLMKALKIIDAETTFLMEKCTMIKLLHRTGISKQILTTNIAKRNEDWWFYSDIKKICERLEIEPEEVCDYPNRTRKKLEDKYYEGNDIDNERIEELKSLLQNYSFKNKKKVVQLIKLDYS
jgi:DNA-binding Xre family transcriptional regulator